MKHPICFFIAVGSCVLGEITGANAATVYVTTNGVGNPPYDAWTNAAPSIQVAIDYASNGDKVLVGPGTYYGNGNRDIDLRGKALAVRGDQGARGTRLDVRGSVDDPHRAFRFSRGESHSSVIDGFTVTGGYGPKDVISNDGKSHWYVGGAIYCVTSSPAIVNCIFRNNNADYGSAIQLWNQSHAQVANCQFIDNRTESHSGVLYAYNRCHASVSNCIFARNQGCALKVDMSSEVTAVGCLVYANSEADAAVHVGNSALSLINCTIADNQYSKGALSTWFSRVALVHNCILWNNTTTGSEIAGTNIVTVLNSCIAGGYPGISVITNNPLFVAGKRDYHLAPGSPCINAATNQPWMIGAADLDGRPRISDGNADIGAYEYGTSGGPTLTSAVMSVVEEQFSDGLAAQQIMEKMATAYATCKSYRDTGSVSNVTGGIYPLITNAAGIRTVAKKPTTFSSVVSFKTAFSRPDRFRFEFQGNRADSRFILWAKENEILTWWSIRPGAEKVQSLGEGIAGATGISGGSAHTVPILLLPDKIEGRKLTDMTELKRLPDETLDGVSCFTLQGKYANSTTTLWLDQKTYLIHRIYTGTPVRNTTTVYLPELNPAVPDSQLELNAPKEK
jgi:hypothetical protein